MHQKKKKTAHLADVVQLDVCDLLHDVRRMGDVRVSIVETWEEIVSAGLHAAWVIHAYQHGASRSAVSVHGVKVVLDELSVKI